MKKVITYGTFDLLHHGHIRLLERAKALGDYLVVGVTSGDFDKVRGKINVQQSLMERIENVRATGLADEIVVEEYEGQKIDDIQLYDIDIFTVGTDWKGQFDYLSEYCEVIYLERTEGISSSEIREENSTIGLGLVGESNVIKKYYKESAVVNGLTVVGIYTGDSALLAEHKDQIYFAESYEALLQKVEAVYIASHPSKHYEQIKKALEMGKHVLCESPIALSETECKEVFELAEKKKLVLMDAIKTAYMTAFNRMLVLVKSGKIGEVVSVDATCTSIRAIPLQDEKAFNMTWNSISDWGPVALLPVLKILGTDWKNHEIYSKMLSGRKDFDLFTKISFTYEDAVATIKVGKGVKSEGELVISGTEGYIYVPAPWWKTDYFELRYENSDNNKRYFYQLDGEGIRNELVAFVRNIKNNHPHSYVDKNITMAIGRLLEEFYKNKIVQI